MIEGELAAVVIHWLIVERDNDVMLSMLSTPVIQYSQSSKSGSHEPSRRSASARSQSYAIVLLVAPERCTLTMVSPPQ